MFQTKSKSSEEQELWKKIEDLESSLKSTETSNKAEIEIKLARLKCQLTEIQIPVKKRNTDFENELDYERIFELLEAGENEKVIEMFSKSEK